MISRPIFHLFLTLTVVIILLGIIFVIFTQFDRGYVALDRENDINTKHQELIKQITQAAAKAGLNQPSKKSEGSRNDNVLTLIEQVKQDDSSDGVLIGNKTQTATDQEIARINHLNQQNYMAQPAPNPYQNPYPGNAYYNDYQGQWLNNNPWSPDYYPNRRY